jgi:hypothetical protein
LSFGRSSSVGGGVRKLGLGVAGINQHYGGVVEVTEQFSFAILH